MHWFEVEMKLDDAVARNTVTAVLEERGYRVDWFDDRHGRASATFRGGFDLLLFPGDRGTVMRVTGDAPNYWVWGIWGVLRSGGQVRHLRNVFVDALRECDALVDDSWG